MTNREIRKRVYETYPVSKKEMTCETEKRRMNEKRGLLKKRLMQQSREKKEYAQP